MSRYSSRRLLKNNLEEYEEFFDDRGVKQITHFGTGVLKYPTVAQVSTLQNVEHIWKVGDRYYKLAAKHYGNPRLWWVIAHYNKKPTEADVQLGGLIYVPLPLERVLSYITE
jgi:nucleoid-associated protein YgaU|tara:strand:+ start:650 stop:985 length:336 start_codon:yes stop_codon:yes gene_type:complete